MLQRPRTALLGAFACLVALVATGVVSHLVPEGRTLDGDALETFSHFRAHDVDEIFARAVHFGDVLPYAVMSLAIVLVAALRARTRLAGILTVVLVASPVSTEILKVVSTRLHNHTESLGEFSVTASWPSGHAAGVMTVALCAVLASPARFRPAVALLGGLLALAVGYAVVVLAWHFPSDVIGAYLVSAGWALGAVAATRRWPDGRAWERRHGTTLPATLAAVGAVAVGSVVVLASYDPSVLLGRASEHPSELAAAIGVGVLALLLPTMLLRVSREP